VHVEELEWGTEAAATMVSRLAAVAVDLVVAADCCYVDQVGWWCCLKGRVQAHLLLAA